MRIKRGDFCSSAQENALEAYSFACRGECAIFNVSICFVVDLSWTIGRSEVASRERVASRGKFCDLSCSCWFSWLLNESFHSFVFYFRNFLVSIACWVRICRRWILIRRRFSRFGYLVLDWMRPLIVTAFIVACLLKFVQLSLQLSFFPSMFCFRIIFKCVLYLDFGVLILF